MSDTPQGAAPGGIQNDAIQGVLEGLLADCDFPTEAGTEMDQLVAATRQNIDLILGVAPGTQINVGTQAKRALEEWNLSKLYEWYRDLLKGQSKELTPQVFFEFKSHKEDIRRIKLIRRKGIEQDKKVSYKGQLCEVIIITRQGRVTIRQPGKTATKTVDPEDLTISTKA